jgi:hypothetical protein
MQRRDRPADQAAPVVADDVRPRLAQSSDQAGDVTGEGPQVVAARGLVGVAVAAQVDRDGAVAAVGEPGELVTPRPPELGEAVEQDDERAAPVALGDVQTDAVGRDRAVRPGAGQPDRRRIRPGPA